MECGGVGSLAFCLCVESGTIRAFHLREAYPPCLPCSRYGRRNLFHQNRSRRHSEITGVRRHPFRQTRDPKSCRFVLDSGGTEEIAVKSLGFERGQKERNVVINSFRTDISILLHPRYEGKFKEGLKGVLERLLKSSVNELMYPPQMPDHGSADDYTADTSAKKITIKEFFHGYIKQAAIRDVDLWIDLYTRITEKGIKNFPAFRYTITETEIVNSCKLSKELGKICKPSWSGIPELPWNGNWLLTKEDFTWKESLRKWERKREFSSSDNGHKWDEALYDA